MKVLREYRILLAVLVAAAWSAAAEPAPKTEAKAAKTSKVIEGQAILEYRLEIFERASANRELAALTQMEQARGLEKQAQEIQSVAQAEDSAERDAAFKKAGKFETDAAHLCGLAAANFDQAAANRKQVEVLSTRLNKAEQQRSARAYALNLTQQANDAMRMASMACERAAEAYDKAGEQVHVASSSQQAAVWLEKLAVR